jgi:hypothetical protein
VQFVGAKGEGMDGDGGRLAGGVSVRTQTPPGFSPEEKVIVVEEPTPV